VTGKYDVSASPRAYKNLVRIDPVMRRRIAAKISELASDPEPAGCKALQGVKPLTLRVRVGDWRIVYRVTHADATLLIIDIDHRGDIYRA
jgi:mRNA interferase RelE/StbE